MLSSLKIEPKSLAHLMTLVITISLISSLVGCSTAKKKEPIFNPIYNEEFFVIPKDSLITIDNTTISTYEDGWYMSSNFMEKVGLATIDQQFNNK